MSYSIDLSLIVPYHNEEENLPLLCSKIIDAFEEISNELSFKNFEIIFIDDGSTDKSTRNLIESIQDLEKSYNFNLRILIFRLHKNMGQSFALSIGFSNFTGKYVSTIDSDLQNDPSDLLPMLKNFIYGNFEVVNGFRVNRREGLRVFISNVGNFLIRLFSFYNIRDVGCSLKLYRDYVIKNLKLPYGYHRFLPIISRAKKEKILNFPVKHFNRFSGKSHYGYSRIFWLLKNVFVLPFLSSFDPHKVKKNIFSLKLLSVVLLLVGFLLYFKGYYLFSIVLLAFVIVFINTILKLRNFLDFQDGLPNNIEERMEFVYGCRKEEVIKNICG